MQEKTEGVGESERRTASKKAVWTEEEARRVLKDLDRSRETVAEFARKRGWMPQRLHWWMSHLGWKRSQPPLSVPPQPAKAPRFLQVQVVTKETPRRLERPREFCGVAVEVGGGALIRVSADFDEGALLRVLRTLREGVSC